MKEFLTKKPILCNEIYYISDDLIEVSGSMDGLVFYDIITEKGDPVLNCNCYIVNSCDVETLSEANECICYDGDTGVNLWLTRE